MDKTIAKTIESNASPITRAAMTATKLTKLVISLSNSNGNLLTELQTHEKQCTGSKREHG
jgi:hypothetical protein